MDHGTDGVEELTLEPATVVRSRRPRALWGVLAAVGLATGALVVTSAGDDGTSRPGLPVALGSGGSERTAGAAADSMMIWVTYVAGDDLPALGGEAPAYRLRGSVDEAQVQALADALGLDGEIVHEGPAWRVAGQGGTLEVYEGSGAQWWYSSGSYDTPVAGSGSGSGVACAEVTDEVVTDCDVTTMTTHPPCTASDGPAECLTGECPPNASCATIEEAPKPLDPPTDTDCAEAFDPACPDDTVNPPADLPSQDAARAIALDLLSATGLEVDDAVVTVDGPYDAWYVAVEPRIDGVPSGLLANVAVGGEGEVISAGGYLSEPEALGDYPVLDTRPAIDRANAQQGDGSAYRGGVAMDAATGGGESPAADEVEEPTTTVVPQCKVQPDGSEICETPGCVNSAGEDAIDRTLVCELPTCPQAVAPADEPVEAPATIECTPPPSDPGGVPEPLPERAPLEVVLVDAEPSLVLLGAIDGSTDAYLVPGYRFTDADGGHIDLPAVADEALTTPPTTDTSAVDPVEPPVTEPGVPPQPCEPLVEEDASGTTHTVQPNPDCVEPDPQVLEEGQEPELGVGYYVDVDTECGAGSFRFAGEIWNIEDATTDGWSSPHEGGTFTLDAADHGTFVGDAGAQTKVAEFSPLGPAEDLFCMPQPRP